jgi:hypothetical protein
MAFFAPAMILAIYISAERVDWSSDVSLTESQPAYPLSFKEDVDGLMTIKRWW